MASPLYTATHWYVPAAVGVNSSDSAVGGGPPASGRLALVKIGAPVQVGLPGPNRVKVTVPVGAGAGGTSPVTVAESLMGRPRVTGPVAAVMIETEAGLTTDASLGAPHGLVTDG